MPLTPAEADRWTSELKASLVYVVSSRIVRAAQRPCLNAHQPPKTLSPNLPYLIKYRGTVLWMIFLEWHFTDGFEIPTSGYHMTPEKNRLRSRQVFKCKSKH